MIKVMEYWPTDGTKFGVIWEGDSYIEGHTFYVDGDGNLLHKESTGAFIGVSPHSMWSLASFERYRSLGRIVFFIKEF